MEKYALTILQPGGNDTALVKGLVLKKDRKRINDAIMKRFPNIEQVGFYDYDGKKGIARLEMAGGEFCGNATRSLAYLILNGKKGKIQVRVSGSKKILQAGINKANTAFAQMPIYETLSSVKKLKSDIYKVKLSGITHLIAESEEDSPERLKDIAKNLLKKTGLLYSQKASGIMFVKENGSGIFIRPVVWVRDIKTLFYETACASGTTAIGLWKAYKSKRSTIKLSVVQPSEKQIKVIVKKSSKSFIDAYIDGPISILNKMEEVL